jgi:hypothetical protein
MRGGVLQLSRWGLLDRLVAAGTPAIRSVRVHLTDTDGSDETNTVVVKPSTGVDALYAPRRNLLDRILVDAAIAAGYLRLLKEVAGDAEGRLHPGEAPSRLWAHPGQPAHVRRPRGPGWALVGDAGHYVDPLRPMFPASDEIGSYQWTLPRVRELMLELSAAMKVEVEALSAR